MKSWLDEERRWLFKMYGAIIVGIAVLRHFFMPSDMGGATRESLGFLAGSTYGAGIVSTMIIVFSVLAVVVIVLANWAAGYCRKLRMRTSAS